jgi:hypothetical protein
LAAPPRIARSVRKISPDVINARESRPLTSFLLAGLYVPGRRCYCFGSRGSSSPRVVCARKKHVGPPYETEPSSSSPSASGARRNRRTGPTSSPPRVLLCPRAPRALDRPQSWVAVVVVVVVVVAVAGGGDRGEGHHYTLYGVLASFRPGPSLIKYFSKSAPATAGPYDVRPHNHSQPPLNNALHRYRRAISYAPLCSLDKICIYRDAYPRSCYSLNFHSTCSIIRITAMFSPLSFFLSFVLFAFVFVLFPSSSSTDLINCRPIGTAAHQGLYE